MLRKNQKVLNCINMMLDATLIFCAYLVATYIRFDMMYGATPALQMVWTGKYFKIAAVYALVLVAAFYAARLYGSYRFQSQRRELWFIFWLNAAGVTALTALLYITRFADFSRLAIFLFFVFSTAFVTIKRICLRAILRYYRSRGSNQKHVILVGCGHFAGQYVQDVKARPYLGFTVDGYVGEQESPALGKRLGRYGDLETILDQYDPDEVVVALEPDEIGSIQSILRLVDKQGVRISIIPFVNDYIPAHPTIDVIGDTKLINMRATPLDNVLWQAVKRTMDIVGALVLIVLTSPLMAIIAVGVRLSSPGPILFRQERVGRNKKLFQMYKFRSMYMDAEKRKKELMEKNQMKGVMFKMDDDPRIIGSGPDGTRHGIGWFIRKTSIDEFPQFWNILKGEMSLVGTRPPTIDEWEKYEYHHRGRMAVKPRLTGMWQVSGRSDITDFEEVVYLDTEYIRNWSIRLDIKILLKTVAVVVKGQGSK